jgi:hypothetical protein
VTVAGKLYRWRESRWPTAPYVAEEHFYREFLVPDELQQVISSERILMPEELYAWLIASEELRKISRQGCLFG